MQRDGEGEGETEKKWHDKGALLAQKTLQENQVHLDSDSLVTNNLHAFLIEISVKSGILLEYNFFFNTDRGYTNYSLYSNHAV